MVGPVTGEGVSDAPGYSAEQRVGPVGRDDECDRGASGRTPVSRRSVLTLWENRPAEVGVPSQNPELTSPEPDRIGTGPARVRRTGWRPGAPGRRRRIGASGRESWLPPLWRRWPVPSATAGRPAPLWWLFRALGPVATGALRGALRDRQTLSPGGGADDRLRCRRRPGGPAGQSRSADPRRGGTLRLRRQRQFRHTGRRRRQPRPDRGRRCGSANSPAIRSTRHCSTMRWPASARLVPTTPAAPPPSGR